MSLDKASGFSVARLVPVFVFLVLAAGLTTLLLLTGRNPVVTNVDPLIVDRGAPLVISGRFFRDLPGGIAIAGQPVPSSSIQEWSDSRIVMTVPQASVSGLLYVETDGGTSAGVLVQMEDEVPRGEAVSYTPGKPQIARLAETEVRIGDLLTIHGSNFGRHRRASSVLFAAPTDSGYTSPSPPAYSYPVWTDTMIQVRVPSGVDSGFVAVDTPWGRSNPMRLRIDRPAGRLVRADNTEIAVLYGVSASEIRTRDGTPGENGGSEVVMWLPLVRSDPGQTRVRYLGLSGCQAEPVAGDQVLRVRAGVTGTDAGVGCNLTVVVQRSGLNLEIDTARVSAVYEGDSGFFSHFTAPTPQLPAGHDGIAEVATTMRRGRANPYLIVKATYDWILDHMDYALYAQDRGAVAGLEQRYGDDFTYATLFVTVLRAARIPSRVVGGVVVTDADAHPHFWSEFFLPTIGWIPVDAAFADGGIPTGLTAPDDPESFYFGNLDSRRIAFSAGALENGPDHRDGWSVIPEDPFTLQLSYVEADWTIESMTVNWHAPRLLMMRPR